MPDSAAPRTRPQRSREARQSPARVLPPRFERDRALFQRLRNPRDRVDRDTVVERFLPLARQIASRYQRSGEPFDDVFQVACFGLVKAVDRFDPARGIAFSSFAVPTIHGEIKRYFRDRTWALRVPRDLQDLSLRVDRVVADLVRENGHQPSIDDVAHAIGVEPEDVLEAIQASNAYRASSLDAPRAVGEDAGTIGDGLGVVEEGYDRAEHRAVLQTLMHSLTLRERNVIALRFEHDLTQAEIGKRIGVSQMQVSRILRHSLARLRTIAEARS